MIDNYKVIGLMSGTSLDGCDLAFCNFRKMGSEWQYDLLEIETIPYQSDFIIKLNNTVNYSSEELLVFDAELGKYFGKVVRSFIDKHQINPDFIASHGHTVYHQPLKGFTLQIGNPNYIHVESGLPVIADFRSLDVALGGEGAPLVPIGDHHLFGNYAACLNLGGISNVSYSKDNKRVAYDIGVCNMVLNHISRKAGFEYDEGGKMAAKGKVIAEILASMNEIHQSKSGKFSLGFEWISEKYFPLVNVDAALNDLLATTVEHISLTLADDINKNVKQGKVLVTGGGAFNDFLIEKTKKKLRRNISLEIPSPQLISFKEALIFGFLGVLRLRNEANCLKSVTGASRDSSGGVLIGF